MSPPRRAPAASFAVVVLCGVLGAGCSKQKVPGRFEVYPVQGVVTYLGNPLAGATVQATPENPAMPPAYGITDQAGRFKLQTYAPGDGAVAGPHAVTVHKKLISASPYREGDPRFVMPPPPKALIPERYFDPKKSGLTLTVDPAGDNRLDIALADK